MKKKLLMLMLGCSMTALLFGCGKSTEETTQPVIEKETAVVQETNETLNEKETREESSSSVIPMKNNNCIEDNDKVYLLDENGKITTKMDANEVSEASFLSEDERALLDTTRFMDYKGHYFLYKGLHHYTADNLNYLVAVDYENERVQVLNVSEDFWPEEVEVYDGKLYATFQNINDYYDRVERCYEDTVDGLVEIDNPMQKVWKKYIDDPSTELVWNRLSTPYYKEKGYFLLQTEDGYIMVDENMNEKQLNLVSRNIPGDYIMDYSNSYIYYSVREPESHDSYEVNTIYIYDISNDISYEAPPYSLNLIGDKIYANVHEMSDEFYQEHHMFEYDVVNGLGKEVFATYDNPVYSTGRFRHVNDSFYYTAICDGKEEWFRCYSDGKEYVKEDMGVARCKDKMTDIGDVFYKGQKLFCDTCNNKYAEVYIEGFQFNLDCAGADRINEQESNHVEQFFDCHMGDSLDYGFDENAHDDEFMDIYEAEEKVNTAFLLGEKYLGVVKQLRICNDTTDCHIIESESQVIYDINTGEKADVFDFTVKSYDELKKIIAAKVQEAFVEDTKDGYNSYVYMYESKEEIYDAVMNADEGAFNIIIFEDHIEVVVTDEVITDWAQYAPHCKFSYDELGFDV